MTERSITRSERVSGPPEAVALREAQQIDLIRRAAGVDAYVGQGAPRHHFGRYVCLHCPDDRHVPPYRPFRLDIHIQQHLAGNPGHRIRFYCWDDSELEDEWRLDGPPGKAGATLLPPPPPPVDNEPLQSPIHPFRIMAALGVLKEAGLIAYPSPPIALRLGLPEPEVALLPYTEAETLEVIRERPGATVKELAETLGVSVSTVKSRVRMLIVGGDVRAELHSLPGRQGARYRRLYPAHNKPIARVRPREQVRITKGRLGR